MIVVDTNIISYFYIPTKYSEQTELLLQIEPKWAAPVLWKSEFRNVLSGYLRKKLFNFDTSISILNEAESLLSDQEYQLSSLSVMNLVSHSDCSAYDCKFVALAEHLNTNLITQDKQILRNFPEITSTLESYLQTKLVPVGTPVTRCPPDRSGHEVFPHPAPRLYSLPLKTNLIIDLATMLLLGDSRLPNMIVFLQVALESLPGVTLPLTATVQPFKTNFYYSVIVIPQ